MHNADSDRDSDGKSVVAPILETEFIAVIPTKLEAVCDSINITQRETDIDANNAAKPKSE